MNDELKASLSHLERILTDAGAAIVPTLRPGLDAAIVETRLAELELRPSAELSTWFGWHDGAGEYGMSNRVIRVVPDGEFYELDYLCGACRESREVAAYVAATSPAGGITADDFWRGTWFPVLRLFGKGYLVVDLAGGGGEVSPVHVIWHYSDLGDGDRARWPSMSAFVENMIRRFETGVYWVDENGIVETESTNIDDLD